MAHALPRACAFTLGVDDHIRCRRCRVSSRHHLQGFSACGSDWSLPQAWWCLPCSLPRVARLRRRPPRLSRRNRPRRSGHHDWAAQCVFGTGRNQRSPNDHLHLGGQWAAQPVESHCADQLLALDERLGSHQRQLPDLGRGVGREGCGQHQQRVRQQRRRRRHGGLRPDDHHRGRTLPSPEALPLRGCRGRHLLPSGVSCHGGGGASSTLVTTVQISSSSFSFGSDTLAIAGGGGGGSSQCDVPSTDGHGGGAGGVAIATGSSPVSAGGGNGNGQHRAPGRLKPFDDRGRKRRRGGGGSGGSRAWRHRERQPLRCLDLHRRLDLGQCRYSNLGNYTAGSGASKGDNSSGSGGGGYGGGGTGDTCSGTSDSAGSGGGGGSYAVGTTATDSNAPTSVPTNPDGSFGAVSLVFDLYDTQPQ